MELKKMLAFLVLVLFNVNQSLAFWRLPCHRAGAARVDPIISPGEPSAHLHILHGGKNIGFDSDQNILNASSCTSCEVVQDRSAYASSTPLRPCFHVFGKSDTSSWTPPLMFVDTNGTVELVQAISMLVYYFLELGAPNITAFPDGFRMISGDTYQRNFTLPVPDPPKSFWTGVDVLQSSLRQKALGFNCMNSQNQEGSLFRHFLPDKDFLDENCVDGLRLELMFPQCWNGKDVDSHDHKSHVAFPLLVMTDECPEEFPVRLPGLFYETMFETNAYVNHSGQFMLANGDPTGFGYHGDFVHAWDAGFLQQAVDTCTNGSGLIQDCPLFDLQDPAVAAQCSMAMPSQLIGENATEPMSALPGNVAVQSGPAYATKMAAPTSTSGNVVTSVVVETVVVVETEVVVAAPHRRHHHHGHHKA